jgi:hypothetical protein
MRYRLTGTVFGEKRVYDRDNYESAAIQFVMMAQAILKLDPALAQQAGATFSVSVKIEAIQDETGH